MKCRVAVALILVSLGPGAALADDFEADRAALLRGVESIAAPGVPGPIMPIGERAFIVACGGVDDGTKAPVVVAVEWGRGRIVAFGHGSYLGRGGLEAGDTAALVRNAVIWCAGMHGTRIGTVRCDDVATSLQQSADDDSAYDVRRLDPRTWHEALDQFDVIVIDASHFGDETQRAALGEYIRRGGGLVTAGLGWGWKQLNPQKNLAHDFPGNQLLAKAGIVWADGYLRTTHADGYAVTDGPPASVHPVTALELLLGADGAPLDIATAKQAAASVLRAARALPDGDRLFRPRLAALARGDRGGRVVSASSPLPAAAALDRVLLALEIDAWLRSPERSQAHPSATAFPGDVPESARRVVKRLDIDTVTPGWHSTGLYAPPGVTIALQFPAEAVGRGVQLRIGAHNDRLWHLENWKRPPEIVISLPVTSQRTLLSNPFGGLVYIEVPGRDAPAPFEVTIRYAVEAPLFVLGQTDLTEWRDDIRHAPGPWAELATDKVILTVPSTVVRELDDPAALLEFWNDVMDACADLAAIPRERLRPERYVTDVQISVGYMHSGYPIMTGLDVAKRFVERDKLAAGEGVWGFFHEMGHNHQRPDWTFGGTGEVTCNLFTLYVLETLCGAPPGIGHDALKPEGRGRAMARHFDAGAPFDAWQREPFLALIMYVQLREAFGWEPFKRIFAAYRDLPNAERPKSDEEKRDQWMVRFSREVGRNLGPFFELWGVPTSSEALDSISDLPAWMPEELEPFIAGSE